jgi:hypothetical protein
MSIGPITHTPGIECWCQQCELTIFLAARLVNIYGENRNLDYIHAAERITGQKVSTEHEAVAHALTSPKETIWACKVCGEALDYVSGHWRHKA